MDYESGTEYVRCSAGWYVQQNMGLLAHALGYEAAEDHDEQGTVYVAYCVDRKNGGSGQVIVVDGGKIWPKLN